jgi:hypothetical protein
VNPDDSPWLPEETWREAAGDPVAPYRLKPADRCDRCSVQAYVRVCFEKWSQKLQVMLPTKYLDFCAHHYREHELALVSSGWQVCSDHRAELTHRPGASA